MYFGMGQLPGLAFTVGQTIAYIEKGIFLLPYIHESRLHARQDVLHLSPVDISHQMGCTSPLVFHHLQLAIVIAYYGQPGFLRHHIGQDGFHELSPPRCFNLPNLSNACPSPKGLFFRYGPGQGLPED